MKMLPKENRLKTKWKTDIFFKSAEEVNNRAKKKKEPMFGGKNKQVIVFNNLASCFVAHFCSPATSHLALLFGSCQNGPYYNCR